MSKTEKVIFTNMCMLLDGEGNVLVQDRVDPKWQGIGFPGGHVEEGESFTDAVIREFREETGLTISDLRLCGIKDWQNDDGSRYMVLCYIANSYSGELKSSEEGEVFWTPLIGLENLKLCYNMKNMLKLFLDDSLTEHYFYKENDDWIEVLK